MDTDALSIFIDETRTAFGPLYISRASVWTVAA